MLLLRSLFTISPSILPHIYLNAENKSQRWLHRTMISNTFPNAKSRKFPLNTCAAACDLYFGLTDNSYWQSWSAVYAGYMAVPDLNSSGASFRASEANQWRLVSLKAVLTANWPPCRPCSCTSPCSTSAITR